MSKNISFTFLFLCSVLPIFAQEIPMDAANDGYTFQACNGVFSGSEGPFSGGDYLNNQNYTITLCADTLGTPVTLDFSVFDLDISGTDDYLIIYDGSNIGANVLGTYTNGQLLGTIISATNGNTDGCLTLNFVSNISGVGSFLAAISCGIPCERPIAVVTHDAPNQGKICVDQTVNFDASTSIQTGGFTIDKYYWDFDDGSLDSSSGAMVSHAYSQPGQYKVSLKLKNNDGCVNSNDIDLIFLVSTFPSFNPISTDSVICVGEVFDLVATPNNYEVTYTNIPELVVGPPNIFPDCPGVPFETILTFEDFAIGQNLADMSDLESICINMEHSFSNDLEIKIQCPDAIEVTLRNYGGEGSWMFLGEPTDLDGTANPDTCEDPLNNVPGIGYDYCWTPSNNNGTWGDNSGIYYYDFTDTQGNYYFNQPYLPAGNYESDNPLDALVGCSLNGDWKLIVTDFLNADNGNLFGWSINFNPEIYPAIEEFTPQIGLGADSSFWSGVNVIGSSNSLDTITIQSFVEGDYSYFYTVVNNHGCSFNDTINITVEFPPTVDIFTDSIKICADSIQLFTTINGIALPLNDNLNYVFQWSPTTGLSDPFVHSPRVFIDSTITYTVISYKQFHPLCFSLDSIVVNGLPNAVAIASDTLLCGVTMFQLNALPVDTNILNAQWENYNPSLNFANVLAFNANITATESGYFDVIWKVENSWCTKTDTTHLSLSIPISIDFLNQTPTCAESCDGNSEVIVSGGFPTNSMQGYNFSWSNGSSSYTIDSLCNGNYSIEVTDSLGCTANNQFFLEEILPLNFTYSVANILCAGFCDGTITIDCPNAADFSFNGGSSFTTDSSLTNCAGNYGVIFRNIFGCSIDTTITITEPLPLVADFTMSPQPTNTNNPRIGFTNETSPSLEGSSNWIFNTPQPLGSSLNENPTFIFPSDSGGIYPVQLIFVNQNQCKDTIIKNVVIYDEVIAFIPNSFTPNGDELNDIFYARLLSEDRSSFNFTIYSRRGELVFQTNDPNIGWNGFKMNKNEPAPSDIYVYELKIKSLVTKENKVFNGSVFLIR